MNSKRIISVCFWATVLCLVLYFCLSHHFSIFCVFRLWPQLHAFALVVASYPNRHRQTHMDLNMCCWLVLPLRYSTISHCRITIPCYDFVHLCLCFGSFIQFHMFVSHSHTLIAAIVPQHCFRQHLHDQ